MFSDAIGIFDRLSLQTEQKVKVRDISDSLKDLMASTALSKLGSLDKGGGFGKESTLTFNFFSLVRTRAIFLRFFKFSCFLFSFSDLTSNGTPSFLHFKKVSFSSGK